MLMSFCAQRRAKTVNCFPDEVFIVHIKVIVRSDQYGLSSA